MSTLKRYGKIILFDTLAILCFIGVILFGWLPGPGGIPLFLAGLGFLAVNHDWAERLLETVKVQGVTVKKKLFPNNVAVRNFYDIGSVMLASAATYFIFTTEHQVLLFGSTGALVFSLFVFLVNRERFDKFSSLFKRKSSKP